MVEFADPIRCERVLSDTEKRSGLPSRRPEYCIGRELVEFIDVETGAVADVILVDKDLSTVIEVGGGLRGLGRGGISEVEEQFRI